MYASRMSDAIRERPKRKSMFLSPEAQRNLATTSARRSTEREAMEEALELLAERDAQRDAMDAFVEWAIAEWGEPSAQDRAAAQMIWRR